MVNFSIFSRFHDFWLRTVVALFYGIFAIFCVQKGGGSFFFLMSCVVALALWESAALGKLLNLSWRWRYTACFLVYVFLFLFFRSHFLILLFLISCVFWLIPAVSLRDRGVLVFCFFYLGLFFFASLSLREISLPFIILPWCIVIASDLGGYFFGRLLGGPKLCVRISPGKTWSGLCGGLVTPLGCLLFFNQEVFHFQNLKNFSIFVLIMALVSNMGDIFESFLKRRVGLKDSGNMFPGHGGILDRIDGLLPVMVLCYGWWVMFG